MATTLRVNQRTWVAEVILRAVSYYDSSKRVPAAETPRRFCGAGFHQRRDGIPPSEVCRWPPSGRLRLPPVRGRRLPTRPTNPLHSRVMLGYVADAAGRQPPREELVCSKRARQRRSPSSSTRTPAPLRFLVRLHSNVSASQGCPAPPPRAPWPASAPTRPCTQPKSRCSRAPAGPHRVSSNPPRKSTNSCPTLYDMVTDGVIEVQDTNVVKAANQRTPAPPKEPHTETRAAARLMRIYMGESDKWQGEPLYEVILKRLRPDGHRGGNRVTAAFSGTEPRATPTRAGTIRSRTSFRS